MGVLREGSGRLRLGWRLLLFGILVFVLLPLVGLLVGLSGWDGIAARSVPLLGAAVGAGWILLRLDGRGPGALGFYLDREAGGELLRGLLLGGGVALGAVAVIALAGGVRWVGEPGTPGRLLSGALSSLWLFGPPAAAEEALFRGYLLQALAEGWGPGRAVVVTSAAFGALHLGNPSVTPLAVVNVAAAGLFLGVVYLRTASLWWASGAHLGWNWAHGFVTDLPVSGLDLVDTPYIEGLPRGAAWVSGGGFGPEGSLLTMVVVALAALYLWRGAWLRPGRAARAADPLIPLPAGAEDPEPRVDSEGRSGP